MFYMYYTIDTSQIGFYKNDNSIMPINWSNVGFCQFSLRRLAHTYSFESNSSTMRPHKIVRMTIFEI